MFSLRKGLVIKNTIFWHAEFYYDEDTYALMLRGKIKPEIHPWGDYTLYIYNVDILDVLDLREINVVGRFGRYVAFTPAEG